MKLPNALSLSIIAGLQLIVNQSFADYWWTPIALAALLAVGKLLQVSVTEPELPAMIEGPAGAMSSPRPEQDKPGGFARFLVG